MRLPNSGINFTILSGMIFLLDFYKKYFILYYNCVKIIFAIFHIAKKMFFNCSFICIA